VAPGSDIESVVYCSSTTPVNLDAEMFGVLPRISNSPRTSFEPRFMLVRAWVASRYGILLNDSDVAYFSYLLRCEIRL
jgi:hypothetical protein